MAVFGTPGRLVSWARRCPQTRQSGTKTSTGKAGRGNPYLNGVLGEIAAASACRTDTFLGERYRRLARRRGKRKAIVATVILSAAIGRGADLRGRVENTDLDAAVVALRSSAAAA